MSTAFPQSTTVRESTQISGTIVAATGQQLLINYVAGDCDVSARATSDETPTSITVHVLVTIREAACEAIGYPRDVTAELRMPWAHRSIVDITGATVPTIDGTLLLHPGWIPPGYQSGLSTVGESDGKIATVTAWTIPTLVASPAPSACQPGPSGFELVQGYGVIPGEPLLPGTYSLSDGTPIVVDRSDQGQLGLYWTPPAHPAGWSVSLQAVTQCQGDTLPPLATLQKIANSLR